MSASKGRTVIQGHRIGVNEALARIPGPKGERFAEVFTHGSLSVEIFAPAASTTSNRTRVTRCMYVVVHGSGSFMYSDERVTFAPGDVLFVPAGVAHRFEDFSDNFVVWVLFYGPEGGERSSAPPPK